MEEHLTVREIITVTVVTMAAVYATVGLVALGRDLGREAIRTLKNSKK